MASSSANAKLPVPQDPLQHEAHELSQWIQTTITTNGVQRSSGFAKPSHALAAAPKVQRQLQRQLRHKPLSPSKLRELKRTIPTPAQALTILRVMRNDRKVLRHIPKAQVTQLCTLLEELTQGETARFRALNAQEFQTLDQVVALLLAHAPMRFRQQGPSTSTPLAPEPDLRLTRRHVMLVLRALNAMATSTLNPNEQRYVQTTKAALVALAAGRSAPLQRLGTSEAPEDRWCCMIVANALLEAHKLLEPKKSAV